MSWKVEPDKIKHFVVGIPLGIVLQVVAVMIFPTQLGLAYTLSIVALVVICYGFELFSKITGKGHADHLDAIAGIIGGAIGILFYYIATAW
ncbi:MAG: hypothetical protein V4725_03735 [Bacteroidota bacterium]